MRIRSRVLLAIMGDTTFQITLNHLAAKEGGRRVDQSVGCRRPLHGGEEVRLCRPCPGSVAAQQQLAGLLHQPLGAGGAALCSADLAQQST